jgi:hypothetical protein
MINKSQARLKIFLVLSLIIISSILIINTINAQSPGERGQDEQGWFTWIWNELTQMLDKVYDILGGTKVSGCFDENNKTIECPKDCFDKDSKIVDCSSGCFDDKGMVIECILLERRLK